MSLHPMLQWRHCFCLVNNAAQLYEVNDNCRTMSAKNSFHCLIILIGVLCKAKRDLTPINKILLVTALRCTLQRNEPVDNL